jgi:hypothetical protein
VSDNVLAPTAVVTMDQIRIQGFGGLVHRRWLRGGQGVVEGTNDEARWRRIGRGWRAGGGQGRRGVGAHAEEEVVWQRQPRGEGRPLDGSRVRRKTWVVR